MPRLKSTTSTFRFGGVTSPNTTQVPDQYLDELLPILSGGELKVLLYITRRTFGFKKASDNISLSQMLNGIRTQDGRQLDAGVGLTKKTLLQAIRSLETQNIIVTERRRSKDRGDEPTSYRLNMSGRTSEKYTDGGPVGEKIHQGGGGESTPGPWGKKSPTQQTVKQHTDFESSNISTNEFLADDEPDRQKSVHPRKTDSQQASAATANPTDAPLKDLIARRAPKRIAMTEDRRAIGSIIERFAQELNDQAPTRSSVTRAMNLFERSGASRDGFVDLLFQARASTKEMRNSPSNRPQKPMAYFFSVVEERLGLKATA
jgi:hypothetical protein